MTTTGKGTADRLISLASGTLPEFGPVAVAEAAAAAGFGGCGVWFDADSWTPATTREVAASFAATGLVPLEIEVVIVGAEFDFDSSQRVFEAGARIGCTEAIVVSTDPDQARFTASFARLAEQAAEHNINACLEFLPIFSVATLPQALAVLVEVAAPNAKLLLDPIHVQRAGATEPELASLNPELISFAQFCDGVAELPGLAELAADARWTALRDDAVDGRLCVGEGDLPLDGFMNALPHAVPLSMELRSAGLRESLPDPVARAKVVYETTNSWLQERGY